jgi:uncharacterized membrane protein YgcG
LTATTGQNQTNALFGDIQEVEYYIVDDPAGTNRNAGLLVRAVDRNLLAPVRNNARHETLLAGVQSLDIAFLEGQNWTDAWEFSDSDPRLPEAIRVRLRLANRQGEQRAPRTIEVLTPWTVRGPDAGQEASGSVPTGSGGGGGGGGGGPEGGGGGSGGGAIIPGGGPVR